MKREFCHYELDALDVDGRYLCRFLWRNMSGKRRSITVPTTANGTKTTALRQVVYFDADEALAVAKRKLLGSDGNLNREVWEEIERVVLRFLEECGR